MTSRSTFCATGSGLPKGFAPIRVHCACVCLQTVGGVRESRRAWKSKDMRPFQHMSACSNVSCLESAKARPTQPSTSTTKTPGDFRAVQKLQIKGRLAMMGSRWLPAALQSTCLGFCLLGAPRLSEISYMLPSCSFLLSDEQTHMLPA